MIEIYSAGFACVILTSIFVGMLLGMYLLHQERPASKARVKHSPTFRVVEIGGKYYVEKLMVFNAWWRLDLLSFQSPEILRYRSPETCPGVTFDTLDEANERMIIECGHATTMLVAKVVSEV